MTSTRVGPGDAAPDFTLPDQDGNPVSLSDYRGQTVILYFYPEASTPACTTQACDFRDSLASLASSKIQVIGISRDQIAALQRFRSAELLNFPLLSDPDRVAHEAYGTWGEKSLYGKTVTGVLRSTFVVNPDGTVRLALYNVKAKGHVAMLRKRLGLDARETFA